MKLPAIELNGFKLVECPLTKQKRSHLSSQEQENYNYLLNAPPKEAMKQFDVFFANRFDPMILSLKTHIALKLKKLSCADRLIKENYRHNPDSLTAMINYGDLLFRKKKRKEFEMLFNSVFDLPLLFPNTRAFYIDDVRAFCTLMGHYFIKESSKATLYYSNAYKIAPNHPATVRLEKLLSAAGKKRLRWYR